MAISKIGAAGLTNGGGSVATNTASGTGALNSNTNGANNTVVGYQAGYSNTTGTRNTFIGFQAGNLGNGDRNVAVGSYCANNMTNGGYNTCMGDGAGNVLSSGSTNTLIGNSAGSAITTGSRNTILGSYNGNQSGLNITTSNNYIVLSDGEGNPRLISNGNGHWGTGVLPDGVGGAGTARFSAVDTSSGSFAAAFSGWYGVGINAIPGDNGSLMYFYYNSVGSPVGRINTNGSSTTYATSSDYRLKENIAPMTGALDTVAQLKPCTYTWKATGIESQGFIAHELQAVIPEAVTGEKDAVNEDGSIKPQGIDTSFIVATLTAAIQELKTEVNSLKAEVDLLKAQLEAK